MLTCSLCNRSVLPHNFVAQVTELEYKTGNYIRHVGVCVQCQMDIYRRNDLYRLLVAYFREHPQKLAMLRQTHMEDLKAA